MSDPVLTFTSHVKGKNANVSIYPDRIEWTQKGSLGRVKDSELIPIRSITSVTVQRDGLAFRKVMVITSGNTIDFRVDKRKADEVKDAITGLMLGGTPAAPSVAASSVADELAKLAALRDAGHLSDDEFAAQKARLLDP